MQNLLLSGVKTTLFRVHTKPTWLSQACYVLPASNWILNKRVSTSSSKPARTVRRTWLFTREGSSPVYPRQVAKPANLLLRSLATESEVNATPDKKPSKFKQFYSQYGPMFVVVHLTTVVMWIYGFFLISKQGYDITQLLNVFEKVSLMSEETVKGIHDKIDNYKTDSAWITGQNIKHFATAYMVYKVIAPFRYAVSIALVRSLIKVLRARGLMK